MSGLRGAWLNAGILLLACASGVAVWATRNSVTTSDSAGRDEQLLPVFRSEEVSRLNVSTSSEKISLEREAGDSGSSAFRLTAPVHELADANRVEKLLSALSSARALRPIDSGPPLSSFGLDKPALRLEVHTPKRVYRLALGGAAPTPAGAHYLQIGSEGDSPKLVVIDKALSEDLTLGLEDLRLKSLVDVSEADVTHIALSAPKLQLALTRKSGSSFVIDAPQEPLADRETVQSFFFQLSRLSATRFLSDAEAEQALGKDRAHFELTTRDSRKLSFEVGGDCPGDPSQLVFVRRTPDVQRACTTRELNATLALEPDDFWDRHAFSLRADEVEELNLSEGQRKQSLVRKGSAFILHERSDAQVELEAGNQRIQSLVEAQGERMQAPKLAELGLEPAQRTITLRSSAARDSGVVAQVVRVGNADAAGNLLVLREQDSTVLRIPREQARAFALDGTLLYSRKLTEFGISSFISAEIERPSGKQVLRRAANEELRLEQPAGFDPDGALAADLMQALGALTAERFVADRDDGSFGFARSALTVRFAFKAEQNEKRERKLRFGDDTALGVYATLDDGPVFVLSRATRDTCEALLINRGVIASGASSLTGVVLEARGRRLRFERRGERFVVTQGSFPEDRISDLLDGLSDLRPEVAVHAGAALPSEGFSSPTLRLELKTKAGPTQTVTFGAGDAWHSTSVFYVRVSGVDATFVIAQSKVRALSDAL